MVRVFHCALFEIVRHAHIVVRSIGIAFACGFTRVSPIFRGRFLLGDQMIEAEYHQRSIVEKCRRRRKLLTRLIWLHNGHRMPGQPPTSCWKRSNDRWNSSCCAGDARRNICAAWSLIRCQPRDALR